MGKKSVDVFKPVKPPLSTVKVAINTETGSRWPDREGKRALRGANLTFANLIGADLSGG